MKEFTTAVQEVEEDFDDEPKGTVFGLDGIECRAFRPKDGQLAVLMASTGRHSTQNEQVAGIINFFASVLDDDSQTYVINRLLDRKDPFGIEQVQDIMEWLVAEWSGRPTRSSSASSQSQRTDGQKSTPPTPALT